MPGTKPVLRSLTTRLLSLMALRSGEGKRALLAASYLFLVIACYLMLKPVRDSLFLDRFGAMKLPLVTLGYAVGAAIFVAFYTRLSRRMEIPTLVIGSLLFFMSNLLAFWWLAREDTDWLYPVLYIWVGVFGAIAPAQVWTFAGDLFTVREAKRAFGLIGAGGIAGGISGGALGAVLSLTIGTINILLVATALLGGAILVILQLREVPLLHRGGERRPPAPRISQTLILIASRSHLRSIATLVFLTAVTTTIADWQFKSVVNAHFTGNEQTAFFSLFYGSVNLIAVALQLLLTSRLILLLGLGGTLLFLPLSLFAATSMLILRPTLWAATLLKGSEQTLKHSIDRATRELLYLPLAPRVKLPVKSAIDMVIDRSGDGMAAILLLALMALAGSATPLALVRPTAAVNVALILAWLLLCWRLRRSYVEELSRSIAAGKVEASNWWEALSGNETLVAIEATLRSGGEPEVLEALDLVARNPQWRLDRPLLELLRHPNPEIQARVMSILMDPAQEGLPEGLTSAFGDEDKQILSECLDLLLAEDTAGRRARIERLLARAGGGARGAWIVLLVRRLGREYLPFARRLIEELLSPSAPSEAREVAARAIGNMPLASGLHELLPELLTDDDPAVASAAALSAGALGDRRILEGVIPLLGSGKTRAAARRALIRQGSKAVPLLLGYLHDGARRGRISPRAVELLASISTAESVAGLLSLLESEDQSLIDAAAAGLERTHWRSQGRIATAAMERGLRRAARRVVHWHRAVLATASGDSGGGASPLEELFASAVWRQWEIARRTLYRLACLLHGRGRVAPAWRALTGTDPIERANATEVIENLPQRRLWAEVLPALEPPRAGGPPPTSGSRPPANRAEIIRSLLNHPPWPRQLALCLAAEDGMKVPEEDLVMAKSIVEKVIALRQVELFGQIPSEELSRLAALAREETLPAGTLLFEEGNPPGDLLVIIEGCIDLERKGRPFGHLGPGDALGAWDLFDEHPRPATARVREESTLLRVDRHAFENLLADNPEIARSLLACLVARLRRLAATAAPARAED